MMTVEMKTAYAHALYWQAARVDYETQNYEGNGCGLPRQADLESRRSVVYVHRWPTTMLLFLNHFLED